MTVLDTPKPDWVTEDVAILREAADRFFCEELAPHIDRWEDEEIIDRWAWDKTGAQGFLCPSVPEEYGGPGGTFAHEAAITESLQMAGLDSFGAPLHSGIVTPYIVHYGTEEQKRRWLPKLVSGEMVSAIAMSEPGAGSDLQRVATTAKRDGNGYVINGAKTFITNGLHADLIVVVAKTDPSEGAKGVSLFVVETEGLDGFRRGRNLKKVGQKSQDTAELFFDDARVPATALLGTEEGEGFSQLMQQLPQERLLIAIHAQTFIERALAMTLNYVKEREAFGQPIIEFQNTQFKLAEAKTEATIARVFLDNCIERHIAGGLDTTTASMAKYWITDLQQKIVDDCLQMHGGYGYMDEYPISRLFRDGRVLRIYAGTNEIMKLLIARSL